MNFKIWIFFLFLSAQLFVSCSLKKERDTPALPVDSFRNVAAINPFAPVDQSPMDMSYCPPDYPVIKIERPDTFPPLARIIYSRPQKKGRTIFGNSSRSLCRYGKEWRLGANEATEIEFFQDVLIGSKKLTKGRYILYCIPNPEKWTLVFNSSLFTWGLHIDTTKNLFKTDIHTEVQSPALEAFTIAFRSAGHSAELIMAWDNVKAILPFIIVDKD